MDTIVFASPILPGQTEAYQAFLDEMQTSRHHAYVASRQRMGIQRERIWIQRMAEGDWAILVVEAEKASHVFHEISTSQDPFDEWFRQQEGTTLDMMRTPSPTTMPLLAFDSSHSDE
jgi:hypothetical protein